MNEIEIRLNEILSKGDNIASQILQVCDDLNADETISLDVQLQNTLQVRLSGEKLEEDVWDRLLPLLPPDEITEEVIRYLIHNKISLLTLCHMQLQNEWMLKLLAYDDAPLYTLAKRYYLSDQYSHLDFIDFYNQYLRNRDDVSLWLLDIYGSAQKRGLLIFLCSSKQEFEHKEILQWHQIADEVRGLTNSKDIEAIYMAYQNADIILTEIAANYFTPEKILLQLSSVKGITHASEIRRNSKKTLSIKRNTEQQL